MTNEEMIKDMLMLQDQLNTEILGKDWRDKNLPWLRGVWLECAELVEHHGWKWWKAPPLVDRQQVLLELVDIFHFGMSSDLSAAESLEELAESYRCTLSVRENFNHLVAGDLIKNVEDIARYSLENNTFPEHYFFETLLGQGYTLFDLYKWYIGKYALNTFRQQNGYKSGEYYKFFYGKEDNGHLAEILLELDEKDDVKALVINSLQNIYDAAVRLGDVRKG